MVSSLTIAAFCLSLILSSLLPIIVIIILGIKKKIDFKALGIGAAVFVVMVLILEPLAHQFFLVWNPSTSAFFKQPVAYGIYGGLMAGIFEETGRFLAFMLLLKKSLNLRGGLGYGFGHGGAEAIILGGLTAVGNLVTSLMINSGALDKTISSLNGKAGSAALIQAKNQLIHMAPGMAAVSGFERVFALLIQLGLTFIVLYAVKNKKYVFFVVAILIHAAIDTPAGFYQKGLGSIWFVECWALLAAIASLIWILKGKKLFTDRNEEHRPEAPTDTTL